MTKIELAKMLYEIERSQGRMLNVSFKTYFNFMWRKERKESVADYLAYMQSK